MCTTKNCKVYKSGVKDKKSRGVQWVVDKENKKKEKGGGESPLLYYDTKKKWNMPSTLREALHEIDLAIHSLMDALDTSIKAVSTQLSLLTNIQDNFARAHPELLITYDTVIRSLQMFVNDNNNTGKVV